MIATITFNPAIDTLYKLDTFMNGDIEEVVNALITADQAEKMQAMGNTDSI